MRPIGIEIFVQILVSLAVRSLTAIERKDRWVNKKKEVDVEIQLHEVVANIDLLGEIKDGGMDAEEELFRLKGMEEYCKAVVELAAVLDWSISYLDLPFQRNP